MASPLASQSVHRSECIASFAWCEVYAWCPRIIFISDCNFQFQTPFHKFTFKITTMKKLLLLACLFAGLQSFNVWKVVKGNGKAQTEQREASGYTSLSSGGPISVEITYGSATTITVEADENILPYIETKVKDGKLIIKVKDMITIKPSVNVKVHVSMKTISAINQSGSGSISGSGDFTNDVKTKFNISGSGSINLAFAKFNGASINMSGSGAIELKGSIAQNLEVSQSGSGRVNCLQAPCENVIANLTGSGNIKVNATKSISGHISGSGHISYTGDATLVSTKVYGSGRIEKI